MWWSSLTYFSLSSSLHSPLTFKNSTMLWTYRIHVLHIIYMHNDSKRELGASFPSFILQVLRVVRNKKKRRCAPGSKTNAWQIAIQFRESNAVHTRWTNNKKRGKEPNRIRGKEKGEEANITEWISHHHVTIVKQKTVYVTVYSSDGGIGTISWP